MKVLENMARDLVGDGGSPNLFFVTDNGVVVTITRDFDVAHRAWHGLATRQPKVESALEDRKNGTIAQVVPREDNPSRLCIHDDSLFLGFNPERFL